MFILSGSAFEVLVILKSNFRTVEGTNKSNTIGLICAWNIRNDKFWKHLSQCLCKIKRKFLASQKKHRGLKCLPQVRDHPACCCLQFQPLQAHTSLSIVFGAYFCFFSPFGNKKNKHLNEVIRNLVQTHCNLVTPNHTTFAYSVALKFKNTYTKSNYATHILIAWTTWKSRWKLKYLKVNFNHTMAKKF